MHGHLSVDLEFSVGQGGLVNSTRGMVCYACGFVARYPDSWSNLDTKLLQQTLPKEKKEQIPVNLRPLLSWHEFLQEFVARCWSERCWPLGWSFILRFHVRSQAPTSEINRPGVEIKYPGNSPLEKFGQPMHDVQR